MPRRPLAKPDEERIIASITEAEKLTSGEIRVHVDHYCKGSTDLKAENLFIHMKMNETEQRNGVLIYVALDDHKVAILGDKGIHEHVGENFWQGTIDLMVDAFREGKLTQGICEGVNAVGQQLAKFYPANGDDKNELSDDVTYG